MSRKGPGFDGLVRQHLAFLSNECGFTLPARAADNPAYLVWHREPLSYRIGLTRDLYVNATAQIKLSSVVLVADIPRLVFTAGFGPLNAVSVHAWAGRAMEKSVQSHAHYLRRLTPLLADPVTALPLMEKAAARRRPPPL
ncbi:hypothetical protein [Streptacidiphilus jiangxiensis]|uniref:hypothetical protein n=1 Tax=Streptacidiphilus jiangxiensis TaxID=235985 RepID=UPI0011604186|nr:hypothetical protein [Streptacidiphilus jiangxiensis]